MAVFDPKINNENLTKCLQTLKEMYTDLDTNHAVLCPREAEFRAYMVLMRLNDGDTLRSVVVVVAVAVAVVVVVVVSK